ncbi:BlaI/MecI/CopY family transcriptional regulator [Roseivirga misakiensis]|uniref:Transcriptional regulator n=1 Tax=Roseivirga misakiensis TaxID=1563681 RepID=A0A1E5SKG9_9BACT|nr:BlaI/MecI/CopY family transcriptional regulator [Roseivirga misakiensis]OEJ99620.1 transcriptional regulator [Roseivirga misakiensis]
MKELTKAEEQIMQVVWSQPKLFIKDIVDLLPDPKPAYNTVGTFLKILENKGFVTREKVGNTFAYTASVKKKAYTQNFMNGFLSNYFEGSAEKLFSFMVEEKKLNIKQVEDLMKKLKDND